MSIFLDISGLVIWSDCYWYGQWTSSNHLTFTNPTVRSLLNLKKVLNTLWCSCSSRFTSITLSDICTLSSCYCHPNLCIMWLISYISALCVTIIVSYTMLVLTSLHIIWYRIISYSFGFISFTFRIDTVRNVDILVYDVVLYQTHHVYK